MRCGSGVRLAESNFSPLMMSPARARKARLPSALPTETTSGSNLAQNRSSTGVSRRFRRVHPSMGHRCAWHAWALDATAIQWGGVIPR